MRNNYFTLLIFAALFCHLQADAKVFTFRNTVVGLNVFAAMEFATPKTNAAEFVNNFDGEWGITYGADISFNIFNAVLIRSGGSLILTQKIGSSGVRRTDARRYTQITEPSIVSYGAKISLIPYLSASEQSIVFFGVGLMKANLKIIRDRTLVGDANAFQEQSKGSETEKSVHIGFSSFFAQNWAIEIEGGYRILNFDDIRYSSSNDVNNNAAPSGQTALNEQLNPLHLDYTGAYLSAGIRISF